MELLNYQRKKPTLSRPPLDQTRTNALGNDIMSNPGFGQHFLKNYRSTVLHTYSHVTLCSLIPTQNSVIQTFWRGKPQLSQIFAANCKHFSQNFKPLKPSEMPQVGEPISGPAFEAPGHRSSRRPPRPRSRARALQPRLCR